MRVLSERIVIERSRRIAPSDARNPNYAGSADMSNDESADERNVIELARVSPAELEREGTEVGFHPERALAIKPTDEHVGSVVVMLRA